MTEVPRIRFRMWVDAELTIEHWFELGQEFDSIAQGHLDAIVKADSEGKKWLLEFYDPLLPEEEAYLRWGTDPGGIVAPAVDATPEDIEKAAEAWANR